MGPMGPMGAMGWLNVGISNWLGRMKNSTDGESAKNAAQLDPCCPGNP